MLDGRSEDEKVKRGAPGRGLKVVRAFTDSLRWGGSRNLMLSSNLLKSKIPICVCVGGGGGEGGVGRTNFQLLMLSPNFLKEKKNFFVKIF